MNTALDALPTPALLLDEAVLQANIDRMAGWARAQGIALRPHAKTHKSIEIARRQIAAGAVGLTVATISEALVFARAGFDDLCIAYTVWIDAAKRPMVHELLTLARVRIGVDSAASAVQLAEAVPAELRDRLELLVEVDSGHHRSGVRPESAGEIAAAAQTLGLRVVGAFTFPGHSYHPEARQAAARDEARALAAAAESLTGAGVDVAVLSGGSSPSAAFADADVLTELRPGVYALGDAQQWELGAMEPAQIAVQVLATVVSRTDAHVIADAGSKMLATDRGAYATGFGRVLDHPEARITALSEHHATIAGLDAPIGTRVRLVPNHVCVAVNLSDAYACVSGDGRVETWPVDARGCNT
ncbi:alanine racemase [Leucobacter japonicus]|uniref:alanine racemase n=1 Tax=Leucobacter japonicus TaxID=1461259 RepID=UPI0006A77BE9|nr:alanine racemase [Leucobacter japonicus]